MISFGLVAITIKLYTAAASAGVAFHLLHATCGTRIRQQTYCPVDHEVVHHLVVPDQSGVERDRAHAVLPRARRCAPRAIIRAGANVLAILPPGVKCA